MSTQHFLDNIETGRKLAQVRRNRGYHTGTYAAGHDWKARKETDKHEIAAIQCLIALRNTVANLREPIPSIDDCIQL